MKIRILPNNSVPKFIQPHHPDSTLNRTFIIFQNKISKNNFYFQVDSSNSCFNSMLLQLYLLKRQLKMLEYMKNIKANIQLINPKIHKDVHKVFCLKQSS